MLSSILIRQDQDVFQTLQDNVEERDTANNRKGTGRLELSYTASVDIKGSHHFVKQQQHTEQGPQMG